MIKQAATAEAFRQFALSLPGAVEGAHAGHPDFRVSGKVFATLGYPDAAWAMVKLTPDQQAARMAADPVMFTPAAGAWGRRGSTLVCLAEADLATVEDAIQDAWRNAATVRAAKPSRGRGEGGATVTAADLAPVFARLRDAIARVALPDIVESTSYRKPSFKAGGKFLLSIKDPETVAIRCVLEEKEHLMESAPDIYFETDHYKGWPAILIRLKNIGDDELDHRLKLAWTLVAPRSKSTAKPGRSRKPAARGTGKSLPDK